MLKFFKSPDGTYGLRRGFPIGVEGPIPEGAVVVEFDEATNPELLASLCGEGGFRWQDHSIVAGQIVRSGQMVVINPPIPMTPTTENRVASLLEWADKFRAALQIAESLDALKIEDAKHLELPTTRVSHERAADGIFNL
jgi:hypothetical protein